MTNPTLKSAIVAAAIALSLAAPAQAQAPEVSRDTGVGQAIALQGNAALRLISAEMKAAVRLMKPVLPARPVRVSAPAGAGASTGATVRCAG